MILYLVRHGQSTWNVEHIVQGQTPHPPLTALGIAQAAAARDELCRVQLDEVLASDQVRAQQTASIIAAPHGLTVVTTPLLREQALGELEGKRYEDLAPEEVPEGTHISEVRWGHGESLADVACRMRDLLDWLRATFEPQARLALVSHGDTLRVLNTVLAGGSHRDVDFETAPTWPNGHVESRILT